MKVAAIEDGLEQAFWNHVNKDQLDYYFFIFDWTQNREQTKILMATEGKKIEGLTLIYADHIVQLRGSRKAVEALLDSVNLETVELQVPLDCEDIVTRKYKPKMTCDLMLMSLAKGEENVQIKHPPVKLGVKDAAEVAGIMRKADPTWWGNITTEDRKSSLQSTYWLGIKRDNRIASIGMIRFFDFGSHVGVVATDEHYRNEGYATSMVSALVQEGLKVSSTVLIHVLSGNAPAVRAYSKVGFKPYKHYLLMRAEKIKD